MEKKIAIRSILDSTYFSGYYLRKKFHAIARAKVYFQTLISNFSSIKVYRFLLLRPIQTNLFNF